MDAVHRCRWPVPEHSTRVTRQDACCEAGVAPATATPRVARVNGGPAESSTNVRLRKVAVGSICYRLVLSGIGYDYGGRPWLPPLLLCRQVGGAGHLWCTWTAFLRLDRLRVRFRRSIGSQVVHLRLGGPDFAPEQAGILLAARESALAGRPTALAAISDTSRLRTPTAAETDTENGTGSAHHVTRGLVVGAPARTRTGNLRIRRPMLYPLSYGGLPEQRTSPWAQVPSRQRRAGCSPAPGTGIVSAKPMGLAPNPRKDTRARNSPCRASDQRPCLRTAAHLHGCVHSWQTAHLRRRRVHIQCGLGRTPTRHSYARRLGDRVHFAYKRHVGCRAGRSPRPGYRPNPRVPRQQLGARHRLRPHAVARLAPGTASGPGGRFCRCGPGRSGPYTHPRPDADTARICSGPRADADTARRRQSGARIRADRIWGFRGLCRIRADRIRGLCGLCRIGSHHCRTARASQPPRIGRIRWYRWLSHRTTQNRGQGDHHLIRHHRPCPGRQSATG